MPKAMKKEEKVKEPAKATPAEEKAPVVAPTPPPPPAPAVKEPDPAPKDPPAPEEVPEEPPVDPEVEEQEAVLQQPLARVLAWNKACANCGMIVSPKWKECPACGGAEYVAAGQAPYAGLDEAVKKRKKPEGA